MRVSLRSDNIPKNKLNQEACQEVSCVQMSLSCLDCWSIVCAVVNSDIILLAGLGQKREHRNHRNHFRFLTLYLLISPVHIKMSAVVK